MGNKPSTPTGMPLGATAAHPSRRPQKSSSLLRDNRPSNGDPRPARPTSEPPAATPADGYFVPPVSPTPDPNFTFSRRQFSGRSGSAMDLSGRSYGVAPGPGVSGGEQVRPASPDLPPPDTLDGLAPTSHLSYLPHGLPDRVDPEEIRVYSDTLNQVTSIWPEYDSIRNVDFERLPPPARRTLQLVLKRLSEQHGSIKELTKELSKQRKELGDELEARNHAIQRRDREISSLRDEVRSMSHSPRESQQQQQDLQVPLRQEDMYDDIVPPDAGRQYSYEGGTPRGEDEVRKLRPWERDIFKATPLLLAEGSREEVRRVVVSRNPSLKPVPGDPHHRRRTDSALSGAEEERINRLQQALEREKRDNEILKDRLQGLTSSPAASLADLRHHKRTISLEEYRERYHQMEALALGKMRKTVGHQLSHTHSKRQLQFLAAVMQRSYDVSAETVRQFREIIKSLILNPANTKAVVRVVGESGGGGVQRHGSALASQIKILESFKPGQGINNNISKLARKTQAGEEIPESLIKQIYGYLEGMSDVTNIADLVEIVVDNLRQDFGDCTTASLLNQSDFSDFIHECCRLCWAMCVPEKQLHVTSRDKWQFDERYHVTDDVNRRRGSAATNARIDFYIWPILFSRVNGGEVLYKGRVELKL